MQIIIWSKFFFLFIGQEPTTWPANNCLQIMVCSCLMPSNCANNILACVKETMPFSILCRITLAWKWQIAVLPKDIHWKNKLGDWLIKLGYSKISWSASVSQINYLPQPSALADNIDLLATGKSRYFAQPHPIIVNYWCLKHLSLRQHYRT